MSENLVGELKLLLKDRRRPEIRQLIDNSKNFAQIEGNPWDVVPTLTEHLTAKVEREEPQFYQFCVDILSAICLKLQPDDVLLILIKEIQAIPTDNTLLVLLQHLRNALTIILCVKRVNYFAWCLNAIQVFIDELPTPDNLNLEGDEKLTMDADPIVFRISNLYHNLLPFYDCFQEQIKSFDSVEMNEILLRNYIQLLGKPLVYLDMELVKGKQKNRARFVVEHIIGNILNLDRNIYHFFEDEFVKNYEDVRIRSLSLANLYYLCVSENIGHDKIPKVYQNVYVFQNCLKFAVKLLEYNDQFIIDKGLQLAEALLRRTLGKIFDYTLLDSESHRKFCKNLSNVIIYNPMESYRKYALSIFKEYLYKFDSKGRYLLIYNIKREIDNISLNAYITTQYKEMLVEQLDKRKEISTYFRGTKLQTILATFCRLPNGVETDLMKEADQIIASLNLLRYLIIRDRGDATGVRVYLGQLDRSYLVPLKTALSLSKAHYELKIKEVATENAHGDQREADGKVCVSIGGKDLPELTKDEKMKVLNSSLTAFDVIDSVLSRVNECLNL